MTLLGYFWDRRPSLAGKLPLDVTTTQVNSALHPLGSANWVPALAGKNVVKSPLPCDSTWHVTFHSSVVKWYSDTNCYIWRMTECATACLNLPQIITNVSANVIHKRIACIQGCLNVPWQQMSRADSDNDKRSSVLTLSLIHIWRCRRIERCRSRWSPYH